MNTTLFDLLPVAPPVRRPVTTRVTCRVCDLAFPATIDRPAPLCDHCAADLVATRAHIRAVWDAAERGYVEAQAALTTLVDAADGPTQARYTTMRNALLACHCMPNARLARNLDVTEAKGDALSPFVSAIRALVAAQYEHSRVEAWAMRANAAVSAWEDESI